MNYFLCKILYLSLALFINNAAAPGLGNEISLQKDDNIVFGFAVGILSANGSTTPPISLFGVQQKGISEIFSLIILMIMKNDMQNNEFGEMITSGDPRAMLDTLFPGFSRAAGLVAASSTSNNGVVSALPHPADHGTTTDLSQYGLGGNVTYYSKITVTHTRQTYSASSSNYI